MEHGFLHVLGLGSRAGDKNLREGRRHAWVSRSRPGAALPSVPPRSQPSDSCVQLHLRAAPHQTGVALPTARAVQPGRPLCGPPGNNSRAPTDESPGPGVVTVVVLGLGEEFSMGPCLFFFAAAAVARASARATSRPAGAARGFLRLGGGA